MAVKFVITTLKPGVDRKVYERWVRERDYVYTNSNPNFVSYRVHRIEGPIAGAEAQDGNILSASRSESRAASAGSGLARGCGAFEGTVR